MNSAAPTSLFARRAAHFACAAVVSLHLLLPAAPAQGAPAAQEPVPGPAEAASAADYALGSVGMPLEGPLAVDFGLPGVHSVQSADFDHDGDLDLVAAERISGRLNWYRNSGGANPTFELRPIAQIPGAYLAIAADVNRDGRTDIVLLAVGEVVSDGNDANGKGSVLWFRNDGAAPVPGFAQRSIATGLNYPVHGQVADLDANGTPDLVVASTTDDTIRWFANQGGADPTFVSRMVAGGVDGAVSVDVGDMDGDGDPDVVSGSENDDRILWHANDGRGNFTPYTVRAGVPPSDLFDGIKSVKVADLDRDGDLDVLYGSEQGNEVGWYQSNGQRPPQFAQRVLTTTRNHVKFVTAGDIDRDGDLDLFSASSDDNTVGWHRNNGAATPEFAPFVLTTAAAGARYVHLADLDGDGDLDVITAARTSGQLAWFRNRTLHRSALFPAEAQRVVGTWTSARHLKSADLDGDGDRDLVSIAGVDLVWYPNDGRMPAQFAPQRIASSILGGRWVDTGDADRDGDVDIIVASTNNNALYWYENNGQQPPYFSEHQLATQIVGPRAVLFGDLDGDGDLDAFAASDGGEGSERGPSRITWHENDGQRPPTFGEQVIDAGLGYARSIFAVDIDRDGDLDLLAADQQQHAVFLYENRGGRPLQFARREVGRGRETLDGAQHVHAEDMDGDGDADVLVASEFNGRITLFENLDGLGRSFGARVVDDAAIKVHAVAAGDADGDGDADLFAAIEGSNLIAWYENNGQRPPQFTKRAIFEQAFVAHSVSAEDVDGDGDLDVLATARDSGHALLFENRGGQYRFAERSFAVQPGSQGTPLAVLGLTAAHLGRAADPPLELVSLEVRFEDGSGNLLPAESVAGRVHALSVYADANGNGVFDGAGDRLLVTETRLDQAAGGRLTVPLTLSPPAPSAGAGGAVTIFVAAELASVCGTSGLRLVVRPTGRTAVESLAGSALLAESMVTLAGGAPAPQVDLQRYLRINEIAANGPGDDWIEIFNTGPYTVDLGGMYLSDELDNPTKHRIPAGIKLKPHGYAVFIADSTYGPYHVGFGLSKGGESLGLFDADSRLNRVLDTITFGAQPENLSSGRSPDGGATWKQLVEPTPGTANVLAGLERRYYLPAVSKSFGC